MKIQNNGTGNGLANTLQEAHAGQNAQKASRVKADSRTSEIPPMDNDSFVTLSEKGKALARTYTASMATETTLSIETVKLGKRIYQMKRSVEALTGKRIHLIMPVKIDFQTHIQVKNNTSVSGTDTPEKEEKASHGDSTIQFSYSGFGLMRTANNAQLNVRLEARLDQSYHLAHHILETHLVSSDP